MYLFIYGCINSILLATLLCGMIQKCCQDGLPVLTIYTTIIAIIGRSPANAVALLLCVARISYNIYFAIYYT